MEILDITEIELGNFRYLNLILKSSSEEFETIRRLTTSQKKHFLEKISITDEINYNELSIGIPLDYSNDVLEYYSEYDLNNIVEVFFNESVMDYKNPSETYNQIQQEFKFLLQTQKINSFFKNHE